MYGFDSRLVHHLGKIQSKCTHPKETLEAKHDGNNGWDYEKY